MNTPRDLSMTRKGSEAMALRQLLVIGTVCTVAANLGLAMKVQQPYLMLVTFGAPDLRAWTPDQCAKMKTWPYAGIASTAVGGYDTGPLPGRKDFEGAVKLLRTNSRCAIWPWVFLNRMIGRGKGEAHTSAVSSAYFERIKGWDLEDKTGARSDFLAIWRLSLQLAKDLGVPGIVLDLETYNDYSTCQLHTLAEYGGWSNGQTIALLRDLGKRMATIAQQEYPSAIIWSFYTELGSNSSTAYLCEGLLEESTKRGIPLKLVDGGETSIGYYNPSAEALISRINSHAATLEPFIRKSQGRLVPGGTIAPYHEPSKLTWWILDASRSGGRTYANMDEFRPNFDALLARCEYVWIYGASAAHCVPFDPSDADTTAALHRVLGEVYPRWQEGYALLPLPLREGGSVPRKPGPHVSYTEQSVDVQEWTKGDPKTDMGQPEVQFGGERQMTKEGPVAVRMTVSVNWREPVGSKYPIGWPMIHKEFSPPVDLSRYNTFEFWLRIHTEATLPSPPIKFGLSNDGKEPFWQGANTTRKDEWVKSQVPLDRIGPRDRITRLTFYVAEAWYRDRDVITFYLDGLKFVRQTTPELGSLTVDPLVISSRSRQSMLHYELLGDAPEQSCRLRWRLEEDKPATVRRQGELPVSSLRGEIAVTMEGLHPGAYTMKVDLLDAKGKRLDRMSARFAVLKDH